MSLLSLPPDLTTSALAVMLIGLAIGAIARGYSGFGFSAVLVSSWALVTDPARAVVVALCLEVAASVMQAFSVWREIPWKRVALLMAGAVIGTPVGAYLLAHAPREPLKLAIGIFVLISAGLLLFGFRLEGKSHASRTAAVGVASGVANGAVANRALELLGKELGMFIERAENRNIEVKQTFAVSPELPTIEEWLAEFGTPRTLNS